MSTNSKETKVKKEKNPNRMRPWYYILMVILAIAFLYNFGSTADTDGMGTYYQERYEEIVAEAEAQMENLYVCEPSDPFSRSNAVIDEAGVLTVKDRNRLLEYMQSIYDTNGVLMHLVYVSEETSSTLSMDEREVYTETLFNEIAAQTSDEGATSHLVVVFADRDAANSSYHMIGGSEARKSLAPFLSGNDYKLEYALKYMDDDGTDSAYASEYASEYMADYYEELATAMADPEAYFYDSADYYAKHAKEYVAQQRKGTIGSVVCGVGFVGMLVYPAFRRRFARGQWQAQTAGDAEKETSGSFGFLRRRKEKQLDNLQDREEFLRRSLESFEDPGALSAAEDVDQEENPFHDLVEKYGGFEGQEELQEADAKEGTDIDGALSDLKAVQIKKSDDES